MERAMESARDSNDQWSPIGEKRMYILPCDHYTVRPYQYIIPLYRSTLPVYYTVIPFDPTMSSLTLARSVLNLRSSESTKTISISLARKGIPGRG